ncbi:tetraacyldisaccharide 4'-kinase [Marinomonas algicola]|uniref:tetraacyldisaccharide 4'-kinase n=1 Tax=Marinomonas algicola TaxID=2773454 RepID=UPI00174A3E26|nr:tetraacyldisaccharide 4'-kinase [Marinomonas algicola]
MNLDRLFSKAWYEGHCWTRCFYPLMPVIKRFVRQKRVRFLESRASLFQSSVPVIVVGNLTVGGTGKSPMVVALCQWLVSNGYTPGIVSRGYGSNNKGAVLVTGDASPEDVGDEPLMLAKRTSCPVVVGRDRVQAVQKLIAEADVDLVISDDGLQHYALDRHIEIVMVDYERGFGNGFLLPVGPLREPIERLKDVHFIASVIQQGQFSECPKYIPKEVSEKFACFPLSVVDLVNVKTGLTADLSVLQSKSAWSVVAAIGNPTRFLNTLTTLNIANDYSTHWLSDHHLLEAKDIPNEGPVVMTEKDAVKCFSLNIQNDDVWYLRVSLQLTEDFKFNLINSLSNFTKVR